MNMATKRGWAWVIALFLAILHGRFAGGADEEYMIAGHPIKPEVYRQYVAGKFVPPREEMSDKEIARKLNLKRPELARVRAALRRGDKKALRRELGRYLDARVPPRNVKVSSKPLRKAIRNKAAVWLADEHEFLGKTYELGERINWWVAVRPGVKSFYYEPYYAGWSVWCGPLEKAYRRSGDRKYADRILTFTRSFYHNARPPRRDGFCDWHGSGFKGAWHSLTTGGRTRRIDATYRAVGGSPGCTDADRVMFLKMAWEHGDYLARLLEKHRAHNFEASITDSLMHSVQTFPDFRDSPAWLERVKKSLLLNMQECILDDGGAFERTTYHFMYLSHHVGTYNKFKALNVPPPAEVTKTLEKMHEWVMWVLAPNGDYPMFGHGGLGSKRYTMKRGAKLFPKRKDFAHVASAGEKGEPPQRVARVLPHTGFLTMRSDWSADALYMAINFNGSPKGTDGYEDLPSFGIWSHGVPWMTNAGMTTAYSTDEWRNFTIRTIGQNTVLVDGTSQDRHDTGGRLETWASLPESGAGFTYCAVVSDAYRRIGKGAVHRRAVFFVRPSYWLMLDQLEGDGKPHDYEWLGHFQPTELTIDSKSKVIVTSPKQGKRLWMTPLEPDSFDLEEGSAPVTTATGKPKYPHRAGRTLAPLIKLRKLQARGPVAYATLFHPRDSEAGAPVIERLAVTREGQDVAMTEAVGCRVRVDGVSDLLVMASGSARRQYGETLATDAEAAWVRESAGRVTAAGLVEGRKLVHEGETLIEVGRDISGAYVVFGRKLLKVWAKGAGEVAVRAGIADLVVLNGETAPARRDGGLLKVRAGSGRRLGVTKLKFAKDALSLARAVGLPPERGPALRNRIAVDSAAAFWTTRSPAMTRVAYRRKGTDAWTRSVNPEPTREHRFVLTNLATGAPYEIRITHYDDEGRIGKLKATYLDQEIAEARKRERAGLVAYYVFDKQRAGRLKDHSGSGNHGRIHGARYVRVGNRHALQFDGVDDFVDCGSRPSLNAEKRGTVSVWCMIEALQGGLINRTSGGNWEDQRLMMTVRPEGYAVAALADGKEHLSGHLRKPEMGVWAHYVMTWNEKSAAFYKDGRLLATHEKTFTPGPRGIPLKLGWSQGFGPKQHFKGLIGEVRIYSRELSALEVSYRFRRLAEQE